MIKCTLRKTYLAIYGNTHDDIIGSEVQRLIKKKKKRKKERKKKTIHHNNSASLLKANKQSFSSEETFKFLEKSLMYFWNFVM